MLNSSLPRWLAAAPPLPACLPPARLLPPRRARPCQTHVRQAQSSPGTQTQVGEPLRHRPCPGEEARPGKPHGRHSAHQPGDYHLDTTIRQECSRPRRRLQREICK